MPTTPSYPGVYVEEFPSDVRTIAGVATTITAFIGRTVRGPTDEPTLLESFAEIERRFGGLSHDLPLGYAIRDFFQNGGQQAIIVRLAGNGQRARETGLNLEASNPGSWGNTLTYVTDATGITPDTARQLGLPDGTVLFNLTLRDNSPGNVQTERFTQVAVSQAAGARRLDPVLQSGSNLARVQTRGDGEPDLPAMPPAMGQTMALSSGTDGGPLSAADFTGSQTTGTGLYAFYRTDLFNLLCVPPDIRGGNTNAMVYQAALAYCFSRRAILIVDPPAEWGDGQNGAATATTALGGFLSAAGLTGPTARNAALYFPRVVQTDPLAGGNSDTFVPCGMAAGCTARSDTSRGVWKAPAGREANLVGTQGLQVNLTDAENRVLNAAGINCLRTFAGSGPIIWGARTLATANETAAAEVYLPVRRLELFLTESLLRGLRWTVFEPNAEPLWDQIRLKVGAFLNGLFRQGAFQGQTPKEAYFIQCDQTTTSPSDAAQGKLILQYGFAPLKPAEFVVATLELPAGPTPG